MKAEALVYSDYGIDNYPYSPHAGNSHWGSIRVCTPPYSYGPCEFMHCYIVHDGLLHYPGRRDAAYKTDKEIVTWTQ